jgi:alpha-beta hydrolase superfamily lysophospholipase
MKYIALLIALPLLSCFGVGEEKSLAELDAEYKKGLSKEIAAQNASEEADQTSKEVQVASFPSLDGLEISAKVYPGKLDAPILLLCHQARYNKSEYDGVAERLQEMGFNCIAIDQRSGGPIGAVQNETFNRAIAQGLPTEYLDAEQDIRAAIGFAKSRFDGPLILWGSSYSSTLALYIAADMDEVQAVIAFSPGDYLADAKGSLVPIMETFAKPYFITSSNSETEALSAMLPTKQAKNQKQFIPQGSGHHGSRALWINQAGGKEYWTEIEKFLLNLFP